MIWYANDDIWISIIYERPLCPNIMNRSGVFCPWVYIYISIHFRHFYQITRITAVVYQPSASSGIELPHWKYNVDDIRLRPLCVLVCTNVWIKGVGVERHCRMVTTGMGEPICAALYLNYFRIFVLADARARHSKDTRTHMHRRPHRKWQWHHRWWILMNRTIDE